MNLKSILRYEPVLDFTDRRVSTFLEERSLL
jgi:hypothetical protein